jgi:hypothetical protein
MTGDYNNAFVDLLRAMAVVVGATEAAGFAVSWNTRGEVELRPIAHLRPDDSTEDVRRAAIEAFSAVALRPARERTDAVITVDDSPNPLGIQFCIVRLFSFNESTGSAATFIVRCQTKQQAQSLLDRLGMWSAAKVWRMVGWR